jgi:protein phosphatase
MGTTATVAALIDDHLFLGQVGDSRAYLLRDDKLVQITRDQSLVNQLIEAGQLTEEEAENFEHNNIILQALGTADSVQVDLTYAELRRGDTLLLCSDGLSGMVRNDEIREVLRSFEDPLEACRELTDRANQAGGHDNVTVVVARFEGEGLPEPTSAEIAELKYRKYELVDAQSSRQPDSYQPSVKTSMRPGRPSGYGRAPDIEVGYTYDDDMPDSGRVDDPVELPREPAPSWIVTMMIVSAVTCVVVAGYYLLR